jgi:hypothetical protein
MRVLRGLLAGGMNPNRAAGLAGVSKSLAYLVDREPGGAAGSGRTGSPPPSSAS